MNPLLLIAVLIIVAFGLYEGTSMIQPAYAAAPDDNVDSEQAPPIMQHIEPTNPNTWPSGDRIWNCCRAIAYAEGYNVAGSNPARLNNPGDISDGRAVYSSEFHSGSSITTFPDANTGWQWLYTKVARAASGESRVYDPSMSWREIGAIWAPPNAEVWASNVAGHLGVDPDSSLGDYING
jgi:hypothetical protein